jgi:hypothetical protein
MQIDHKINDFLYTIFPELENANEKEIINAIEKYFTYGPFLQRVSSLGIDPNKKDYIISSLNKKRFSGNQVLAFYYVSWALAMPEQVQHLGLEFGKEFEMAKKIQQ